MAPTDRISKDIAVFILPPKACTCHLDILYLLHSAGRRNVQTRSCIWYTIVYEPSAFIFHPPELLRRLTEAKTTLCCSCLENMKTEGADLWCVVLGTSPPGYNLHIHNTRTQSRGSNLWALSRVTAITASDMIGQPCHLPQSYTACVHEKPNLTKLFMNTESVCNNQSYRTSKSLLGMWNGKWKTSSIIFPCHEISTPLTR